MSVTDDVATLRLTPPRLVGAPTPSTTRVEHLAAGPWAPDPPATPAGLLGVVRTALLVREVSIGDSASAELVGPGDLVIFGADDEHLLPISSTAWTVLHGGSIVWLSSSLEQAIAHSPWLGAKLLGRAQRRIDHLAVCQSIAQLKRIEDRVLAMLWHLAERWGRVTVAGVVLEMGLTHRALARLVGARRPSVTTAVGALVRQGILERTEQGWRLSAEPPEWWYSPQREASPWPDALLHFSIEAPRPTAA